jgi:hypothetical protein
MTVGSGCDVVLMQGTELPPRASVCGDGWNVQARTDDKVVLGRSCGSVELGVPPGGVHPEALPADAGPCGSVT